MRIKLFCFTLMVIPITSAYADIIISGAVNGPISVTTQNTSIIGSTTVTSTGANFGANVTGSLLTIDSLLTPFPGPILIQTLNGNALNANGGNISASNNVTLLTRNGHAVLANSSSTIN